MDGDQAHIQKHLMLTIIHLVSADHKLRIVGDQIPALNVRGSPLTYRIEKELGAFAMTRGLGGAGRF
jgi:hypothetical protein